MVLLVLAVIWAAVLIPPMVRARAEGRPADSIGDFRRRLHVLERTSPTAVPAANSLRTATPATAAWRPGPSAYGAAPRMTARQRAQKRRRDILFLLLSAMAGSLVLGALPALRVLWGVHLVLDVLFAAYIALLVRLRNLAAEREVKVRFLPQPRPHADPVLLFRRSAN